MEDTIRSAPNQIGTLFEDAVRRAAPAPVELPAGALLNMELSHLAFNQRVLELARDAETPLLERVRFLAIVGGNLDKFFMTRVAGFKRQIALGNEKTTLDGLSPAEQLRLIDLRTRDLLSSIETEVLPGLLDALRRHGLRLLQWSDLSDDERSQLRASYAHALDASIAPIRIPTAGRFPHVRNLRPVLLVRTLNEETSMEEQELIELPGDLPRLLPLRGGRRFLPIEALIRADLVRRLYPRVPLEAHVFRVTRSGNLSLDADDIPNIVQAVAENLARRPFQPVVRLEVETAMPIGLRAELLERLARDSRGQSELNDRDLYVVRSPLDLSRFGEIADLPIDDLKYPRVSRGSPFRRNQTVFDRVDRGEVLTRFPAHSFARTVERFVYEAGRDPAVEEIRITLYRTSRVSRLVRLLRQAHGKGKRVVVLIEVKASFDESRNIEWGHMLESAGIEVLYGPPSLKVHAKIASIVRREGEGRRLYSYIGTGNLNASTAAAYTDLGLFTADPAIGKDVENLFETLAGKTEVVDYDALIVAPFNMRQRFISLIEREIRHAREGRGGRLTAKLNGVADREIIAALYRASMAGVEVDLIVRGICAVRPGVEEYSRNIRVVAIAGRYLEHSRVFRFENGGTPEYFIGSADWRGRNLSRRVEVVAPVRDRRHRRALDHILARHLDDPGAWELAGDGRYIRRHDPLERVHASIVTASWPS